MSNDDLLTIVAQKKKEKGKKKNETHMKKTKKLKK